MALPTLCLGQTEPIIISEPQSQAAGVSSNATFSVVAIGTAPLNYQWQFNGVNLADDLRIQGSHSNVLMLTALQLSDAGNYQVMVVNGFGSATSSVAVLRVVVPPSIITQPQGQSVAIGATVSFSVIANGDPTLLYQWRLNGANIPDATGTTLTLPNIQTSQAGNYSVVVSNDGGRVTSADASLEVLPVLLPRPLSDFTFDGHPYDIFSNSPPADLVGTIFTNHSLFLNGLYEFGQPPGYHAVANIPALSYTSFTFSLDFSAIDFASGHGTILVGGTAYRWLAFHLNNGQLELTLNNDSVSYVFSGVPVATGQWHKLVCSVDVSQRTIITFLDSRRLQDITLDLAFQFNVVGTPSEQSDKQFTFADYSIGSTFYGYAANLIVFTRALIPAEVTALDSSPPVILFQPQSQTAFIGGTASFNVVATGQPPLSYQWARNGVDLPGATSPTLSLSNAQASDAGTYSVLVANIFGSTPSSNALLTVVVPPSTATNPPTHIYDLGSDPSQPGQFLNPRGLGTDSSGNLYVADTFNHRIQKFSPTGSFLLQWGTFGADSGQFNQPSAVVIGGGIVYVVDTGNDRVQEFDLNGNYLTQFGSFGSGPGQFDQPRQAALDTNGNLYIVELANCRVQKFAPNGTFLLQWGSRGAGEGQFRSPRGVAVSPGGNVYVADYSNNRIQVFSGNGAYLFQWGALGTLPGQFQQPHSLAIDTNGMVYVSDSGNDRIQYFNADGTFVGAWGSTGKDPGQLNAPTGVALDGLGHLYVAEFNNCRVQEFTLTGASVVILGDPYVPYRFISPSGVALDSNGNFYVADLNRVQKFNSQGIYLTQWGGPGTNAGQFKSTAGIAIAPGNSVYVLDFGNHRVQKFTSDGVFLTQWGIEGQNPGQFELPEGLGVDGEGNVFVADTGNQRVQKFDSSGHYLTGWSFFGTNDQLLNPTGIALDSLGNVYVSDFGFTANGLSQIARVVKFDSAGNFLLEWGSYGTGAGQFDEPWAISIDAAGNVYVADANNSRIQKFDEQGRFLAQWGSFGTLPGQFGFPDGVAVDSSGNLIYIADASDNRVEVFGYIFPPFITTQPASQQASLGGSATFTVFASSPGPLTYQWQFNGADIPGATLPALTLTEIQVGNAGNYQVILSNAYGATLSDIATLSVPGTAPSIQVQPQSQVVAVGSNVTFSVTATGDPAPTYQWSYNGAPVPSATSSSLVILGARVANGGVYQVTVANPFGTVTSSPATLAVYTAPVIVQPPVSAQVTVGSPASFSVLASSSGPLSYQWYFEGTALPGATASLFSISSAQFSDAGNYSVQVSGLAGSVTSPDAALLVVEPSVPPVVLSTYTIQIQPGQNLIANQLNHGGNTLLEIMPIVPDGSVVSKFDNASQTWLRSSYHAVLGAWVPANITLHPGEGAFFQSPAPYTLVITGLPQTPVLPVVISPGQAYLLSRQTNDVGTYENIVGTPPLLDATVYKWNNASASYTVFTYTALGWTGGTAPTAAVGEALWIAPAGGAPVPIPVPPSITQQPTNVTVAQGNSATFMVQASGTEPLTFQWRLNGNDIPGATSNVLTIDSVQLASAGNYSVAVNNSIGVADSDIVSLDIAGLNPLPFGNFAHAGSLGSATSGAGTGSNVGAVSAAGSPTPLGLPGGAAVWLRWFPPVNGLATFSTAGSGFDTMLGAYTGTALSNLVQVAADDDSAGFLCSQVSFPVTAGTVYFIQVDGFNAATGDITLAWNLVPQANPPPTIVSQPQSQTVPAGSNVTVSVVVQQDAVFSYQWYFNGLTLPGATADSLSITGFSLANVGFYVVAVTNIQTGAGILSIPASLQLIISDQAQRGNPASVSAQDKFSAATALTPPDPNIPHDPAPAGSFTGTQVFSTVGATADPSEPDHCGYTPCATYWCSYLAPASGLLTIDTRGTTFNAILEVYTGPGTNFSSLVPVACSANHGAVVGESVTFAATAGTQYWIVIDGVGCATGAATINYNLSATPHFTTQPVSQTAPGGSRLVLNAVVVGAPLLGYQWRLNGTNVPGATLASLVLPSFQAGQQGDYTITATNIYGTNVSVTATVYMSDPARFINALKTSNSFSALFIGSVNTGYVFEASSNLTDWFAVRTNSSPIGIINFNDSSATGQTKFYRGRKR